MCFVKIMFVFTMHVKCTFPIIVHQGRGDLIVVVRLHFMSKYFPFNGMCCFICVGTSVTTNNIMR